mgnify:CR=1 FL=1
MVPHNDDVLLVHLTYLKDGVDECRELLKAQNSRLGKTETDIAVLSDRADDAKTSGRNWGAGAGTAGGFLGGFVASVVSKLLGGPPS